MWIFTRYGFLSVVNTPSGSDNIQVRSRERIHLESIQERFGSDVPALRDAEIISYDDPNHYKEYGHRDYEHRIILEVQSWVELAALLASDVTYSNFKSEVAVQSNDTMLGATDYYERLVRVYFTMEDEKRYDTEMNN